MSLVAFKQYRLVMWKNWKYFYRNITGIILNFVAPILFITIILFFRFESIREYTVDSWRVCPPPIPLNTTLRYALLEPIQWVSYLFSYYSFCPGSVQGLIMTTMCYSRRTLRSHALVHVFIKGCRTIHMSETTSITLCALSEIICSC